jgi:hypothetical protein
VNGLGRGVKKNPPPPPRNVGKEVTVTACQLPTVA